MTGPRPLQFFLDKSGVSTVSLETDGSSIVCDCVAYKRSKDKKCKHTDWVTERVDPRTGVYPVQISKRATEHETKEAFGGNLALYRDFLFKYGRVEVLEDAER